MPLPPTIIVAAAILKDKHSPLKARLEAHHVLLRRTAGNSNAENVIFEALADIALALSQGVKEEEWI